jgi:hypothetical protein
VEAPLTVFALLAVETPLATDPPSAFNPFSRIASLSSKAAFSETLDSRDEGRRAGSEVERLRVVLGREE